MDDLTKIEGLDEFLRKIECTWDSKPRSNYLVYPGSAEVINDALEFMPQRILKMMWAQQAVRLINERR